MAYDPKDDVDRLFACFKCGISTPESALKERKSRLERSKRASLVEGGASLVAKVVRPTSSRQEERVSPNKEEPVVSTSVAIKSNKSKQISPIVFYGSPHGAPVKKPSQLLRLLREIHVDLREQNSLIPRKEVWATFPRQDEAMRFWKTHAHASVFSYQDHLSGQRRFLVSTYDELWGRYKNMDSKLHHHYEVIQEGAPCHLYFDLEFDKKINNDRNVDEMVDTLIFVTYKVLFDKYSIQGNEEWVVELDSSTKEKFSRHLIIRIPKTAFKDNSHVGAFVSEVCSHIASLRGSDPQLDKLYIRKDTSCPESSCQLFLDNAVYSRNRCFRLAFSSKAGKTSFLMPTGRFKCKNMSEQQVFMESLICRMDVDCEKLLKCKMDLDCNKILYFDSEARETNSNPQQTVLFNTYRSDFPSTYFSGKSPFPALDAFVESIASIGNVPGRIRSWYWFSVCGLMVYNMSKSRYCERIGREHKSNHVMYIVDFQRPGYYQKCYDPDCRGYRSPLRPVPWDLIPDSRALFSSVNTENCREIMDIGFDTQFDGNNMENNSCDNGELITDSCKKDSSWWQEAMRHADCIEKTRNAAELSKLEDTVEDCEWWSDAERFINQVEEHIG
ncbi:uncharacterized protein [Elaeis guineensis]|uniref:DNA-directed primase/polymerase protein n=1 Tax=Elaeis guineensis var. tenera TaxID=51953 RepID=A0A8N4EVM4_ELAGV|nr:DNA-directed primase/polymerase protein isoform X1 [Elaeis guineensis]